MNCAGCGTELTGKQRKWCSDTCSKEAARAARLRAIFDLSVEDYDLIVAEQGGMCAVCGLPPKPGARLAIDHDHRSSLVRGALCTRCNLVVIARHTDPHLLERAAQYLTDPPARRALGRDVVAPGRPKKKRKPRTQRRKKAA